MNINNKVLLIAKIIVSIVLMIFIFNNINLKETANYLNQFNLWYFLLALFVLSAQTFIATVRWSRVLKPLKINVKLSSLLKYLWIGLFFNQVLPSSVGGDALKGYYLFQNGFGMKKSVIG